MKENNPNYNSTLGHWVVNHANDKHSWSDELYTILGLTKTKVKPSTKAFEALIHPQDKIAVISFLKSCQSCTNTKQISYRLLLNNNHIKHVTQSCYTLFDSKNKAIQTITIIQDVTHFENTKLERQKSEEKFQSVFKHSPIAIALIDNRLKPFMVNSQFCEILGYSEDALKQLTVKEITFPEDFENNYLLFEKLFKGHIGSFTISKRYIKKDQNIIWVKVTVSAINNTNSNPTVAIAMVQNISAEKKATEELVKSEYKYRTLIENANDGIGLFSLNMKPLIYNTSLFDMLGYTLSEYLKFDHNNYELFHPEDKEAAKNAIEKVQQNQKVKIEKRLINKDGTYKQYSVSYIPVIHEDKPAILIFRRDISKRKMAEEQNEEYRLFLETIMEHLPVSLFAKTTPDFRYLYWNKSMELMTGISAEDAIGHTDNELFQLRKTAEEYHSDDQKVLKSKRRIEKEHVYTNIIGQEKQVKTIKTLHAPPTGNPIVLGISMDITKLKNIEKHVEQSDQLLKEAQKITKLGYWEYDTKKDLILDNKENRQIFGTTNINYFLNREQLLDIILPADHHILNEDLKNCVDNKIQGEGVIRINIANKIKHVALNYKPVFNNNDEVIKLRGTSLDITRIQESEIALRESETRLKQAEHIAKVGYWNYDYTTQKTEFSDEVSIILEMPISNDNIEFNQLFNAVHPDDKIATAAIFHKSRGSDKPFDFDFRIVTSQNETKYIKAKGTFVKNNKGDLIRSIGTFQDISELRLQQIELEKYTNHLQSIQKTSKTGYIESELNKSLIHYSDTLLNILNIKSQINTIEEYHSLIYSEDKEFVINQLNQTIKAKDTHNIQYRLKLTNGDIKFVNEICNITKQTNSTRYYINRIIQDISYIKEKEIALSRSESHLKQAIKVNNIGIWEYNITTEKYTFSHEVMRILSLQERYENIAFKTVLNQIHPEDQFSVKRIFSKSYKLKENYTLSYRIIPFNSDEIRYIKDTGRFIQNNLGEWIISGTISDISKTKKSDQQLNEANDIIKIISENSTNAIGIIQNNNIVFFNSKWLQLLEYNTNNNFEDIICKEINANIENNLEGESIELSTGSGKKIKTGFSLTQTEYNKKPAYLVQLF